MTRSVYLNDGHNRMRLMEFCGSLTDELIELIDLLDRVTHDALSDGRKAQIHNDVGVLAGDALADMQILMPMLRDVYQKRELIVER